MLQAHSLFWDYLWVAPNVLLLTLVLVLWKRGLSREFPSFVLFALLSAVGDLAVFGADIAPFISPAFFWRIEWVNLLVEGLLKFVLIGEVFASVLNPYPSISRLGRILMSGFGAVLVLGSGLIAAFSRGDTPLRLVAGFHLLEQTVFIIELGLIVFLFLFVAHFRLSWDRLPFGILLGLGISACEHLAAWAVIANASPSEHTRTLFDFLDMATFHVCVLVWYYYVLVPGEVAKKSAVDLPENSLAVWNRELERLLQQ